MVKIEDNKLGTAGSTADNRIAIKVISQDGNHLSMKMCRTTKLRKVMELFCERKGFEFKSVAFTFDHRKVGEDQTPEQLGMEDGAEMEAHKSTFGG
ncbi:small ubiquitin-related modifier 1-like [Curcuma longa]|uniref:small ubiquitin-related modifier 1-like n=1 Tax=Curcuma longa TaxID=136217 RepID=UPI003D9E45D9